MRRVSVVGNSGSGKTTLARALARRLAVPHLELDAVVHQPGWTELPEGEFRRRVADFVSQSAWVVDGNYSVVRDLVWGRADTVVWLDHSRRLVMWRVTRRTVGRLLLRRELWNGNREPWSNLFSRDPQRSILAWAWTNHWKYRQRYLQASQDPRYERLQFVAIRTEADVRQLLEAIVDE